MAETQETKMIKSIRTRKPERILYLSLVCVLFLVSAAHAQVESAKFPVRPITLIVPLPAGTSGDVVFRVFARAGEKFLGQPVVVVNKPGGGTTIGAAALAVAKPDGYTLGYTTPSAILVYPFVEKLPYNPMKDFQQIMQNSEYNSGVFVKGDSSFNTFKDLIAFARQNPGKLRYGTNGPYSIQNLTMCLIAKKEKVQLIHIPYKGGAETQTALLGGHIDFGVSDFNYPLIESRQIKLLALLGEKRGKEYYPQVPTLKTLGYESRDIPPPSTYQGIAGPKGIPEDILKKLEDAFAKATKDADFLKSMDEQRIPVVYRNSKEISDYIAHAYAFYEKLLGTEESRKIFEK